MANETIKQLTDSTGTQVFPQTSVEALFAPSGDSGKFLVTNNAHGVEESTYGEDSYIKSPSTNNTNGYVLSVDSTSETGTSWIPKPDNGKSAYDIWVENGHSGETQTQYLEWLKGEIGGFIFVSFDQNASQTIGDRETSIGSQQPGNDTMDRIVLMPNAATNPTGTVMYVTNEITGTPPTYEFVCVGELDVDASTFVQQSQIDSTQMNNPSENSISKARDLLATKNKSLYLDLNTTYIEGTTLQGYRVKANGVLEQTSQNFNCKKFNCLGYDYVVVYAGVYETENSDQISASFGFYSEEPNDDTVVPIAYYNYQRFGQGNGVDYKQYRFRIPKNAAWFATNSKSPQFPDLENTFYCYFLKGNTQTSNECIVHLIGNDNEPIYSDFYPIIENHSYKIYIRNTNININNVTISNDYSRAVCYIIDESRILHSSNHVFNYKGNTGETLSGEYEFTAESNGFICFLMRANVGEKQTFVISDITYIDEKYQNISNNVDQIVQAFSYETTPTIVDEITGYYRGNAGEVVDTGNVTALSGKKYSVTPGTTYTYTTKINSSSYYKFYTCFFLDANNIILKRYGWIYQGDGATTLSKNVIAPEDSAYMCLNYQNSYSSAFKCTELQENFVNVNEIADIVYEQGSKIVLLAENVDEINGSLETVSGYTDVNPDETITSQFYKGSVNSQISTGNSTNMRGRKFTVTPGNTYYFKDYAPSNIYGVYMLLWCDNNNIVLKRNFYASKDNVNNWSEIVTAPENSAYAYVNYYSTTNNYKFQSVTIEMVNVSQLKTDVDELKSQVGTENKLMKVVINNTGGRSIDNAFYIRTKYNDSKDIILQQRFNGNGVIGFNATYIGSNQLTDVQLMSSTYEVVNCSDSTAPFFGSNNYWAIFGQHGYPIPYFTKPDGMTQNSVGSLWKDQINREYTIGYVGETSVYLLPKFYVDNDGHTVRDWSYTGHTDAITSLVYVSGTSTFQNTISVTTSQSQRYKIMEVSNRNFVVDGNVITEPGTYYCDYFSVNEEQIGYDPSTVQNSNWFAVSQEGSSTLLADLTGADQMAIFTWSYNWYGCHCAMNTTVKLLKEINCFSYGALQQQFFVDNNGYEAYMMIPKAKAHNNVTLNVPFHSNSSAANHEQYRSTEYLLNVDDPCDRQIGYLVNPNNGEYKIGLGAGLSLVSGDTVRVKRIAGMNSVHHAGNRHERVSSIDPSQANKFYVAAINTSLYESSQYYLPAGYFKEINCYVSYFDPAENHGQVYWYKDGSKYVIYCHSQDEATNIAINVPVCMEGLSLSTVEKTNGTTLLTDVVTNGKFYVSYDNNNANYIVLVAS